MKGYTITYQTNRTFSYIVRRGDIFIGNTETFRGARFLAWRDARRRAKVRSFNEAP